MELWLLGNADFFRYVDGDFRRVAVTYYDTRSCLLRLPMVPPQTTEVRCAVRFPIRLAVRVFTEQGETEAWTKNISAGGVLLELESLLQVGGSVEFSMKMPATVLGTPNDVVVHCEGRVVRSSASPPGYEAAAVIDQYRFID